MRLFKLYILLILLIIVSDALGQKELIMSQYMYNKYSINPGFGGAQESLSVYGSFRKKWLGFEESPTGTFFTINSSLKNEKMALGAQFFSDKFAVSQNTGFNISYNYRLHLKNNSTLSLGIHGGLVNYKSDWNQVILIDENDHLFSTTEQATAPWIGFGAAYYGNKYFAGFSIPSFIFHNRYENGKNTLDFNKLDYLFTGGYLFKLNKSISLQPSALLRVNLDDKTFFDISATCILMNTLMLGSSYRTTNQIIGIVGYQITPQFRFTYSLDYDIDPIGSYSNGTHEVAIQFNFGHKINSPDPKFF